MLIDHLTSNTNLWKLFDFLQSECGGKVLYVKTKAFLNEEIVGWFYGTLFHHSLKRFNRVLKNNIWVWWQCATNIYDIASDIKIINSEWIPCAEHEYDPIKA